MCRAVAKSGNKKRFNSSKKNSEKVESKWQKKWIFVAIGLSLVVIIFVLSSKMNFSATSNPIEPQFYINHVIRHSIDVAKQQTEIESRMSYHLLGDPLGEIIKNELRPIQERIASLRIQTSQYEKMQRIPGGPTSFIASSLKEIDNIISHRLLDLFAKVSFILLDVGHNSIVISKKISELNALHKKRSDARSIKEMVSENVTLIRTPMEPDMEKEIGDLADKTTMEECVVKLNNFADLYDRLEELEMKQSNKLKDVFGVEGLSTLEPNTGVADEMFDVLSLKYQFDAQRALIENEKFKLQKYFAVFALFMERTLDNLLKMSTKLRTFVEDERYSYIKLQDMISTDAINLKIRVQNLQYTYAKRRSEL